MNESIIKSVLNEEIVKDPLKIEEEDSKNGISILATDNIVEQDALRKVQFRTLSKISKSLQHTYGPMGSNTLILSGSNKDTLVADYSKDGHKVLKHITYQDPIEMSIQSQLVDITHHVEHEVGDGTTSAVLLSAAIFSQLCGLPQSKNPYNMMRKFKKIVSMIQKEISSCKRDLDVDDVYNMALISTNGNEYIANNLKDIYKEFGSDVYIDTTISSTQDDQIKIYDGLTLNEGYSDSAYINSNTGRSIIKNPRIYSFMDPIDTPEMISFFEKIIYDNIMIPSGNGDECIPTVILAPKMSRDMSDLVGKLIDVLYSFDAQHMQTQKPPILVVTNLGVYLDQYYDIGRLCGCKWIRKYNDPKIQKADIEKGTAPTLETITEFYGSCEVVEADIAMTKFITPKDMYTGELNEDGEPIPSPVFANLLQFLQSELENAIKDNTDVTSINLLRKRIQSLKANMIEYQVGGINISDRDSAKDLIEDAVKNCRSASKNGIGFAANFEGFRASLKVYEQLKMINSDNTTISISKAIVKAYQEVIIKLYNSLFCDESKSEEILEESLQKNIPFNIATESYDGLVLTSIDTDIKILDAISKIITMMFTSNQALVQVPGLNKYQ